MSSCPIPGTSSPNTTPKPDTESPTASQVRSQFLTNMLAAVANRPYSQTTLAQVASELAYRSELAELVGKHWGSGRKVSSALGRYFNLLFSLPNWDFAKLLEEGKVTGKNILRAIPLKADTLSTTASRLEFARRVDKVYKDFKALFPKGTPNVSDLFRDSVEVFSLQRLQGYNVKGKAAQRLLNNELDALITRLKDAGITAAKYDTLVKLVSDFVEVTDNIRTIAGALGIDISSVYGVGYFPRILRDDFIIRRKKALATEFAEYFTLEPDFDANKARLGSPGATLQRQSFDFTLRDEYLAAEKLLGLTPETTKRSVTTWRKRLQRLEAVYKRRLDDLQAEGAKPDPDAKRLKSLERKYERAREKYQRNLDDFNATYSKPLVELYKLFDDEGRLIDTLHSFSVEQLIALADEGILDKIPMTSNRLFEYLVRRFELPYKHINELLIADPTKAFNEYVRSLEHDFAVGGMDHNFKVFALENGYGVGESTFKENPSEYEGYVQVGDIYVQRDLAEYFKSYRQLVTNPVSLGLIGDLWARYTKILKRALMTSARYVFVNLFGSAIQFTTGGGNFLQVPIALKAYADYLTRGVEALDNTKRVYSGRTLREVVLEAVGAGRLTLTDLLGESIDSVSGSVRSNLRWFARELLEGNVLGAGRDLFSAVELTTQKVFTAVAYPGAFFEDTFKLAYLLSQLDDTSPWRFGDLLTGGVTRTNSFEQAIRNVDKYFINYERSRTNVDTVITSLFSDFWTFTSRNLANQVRLAYRRPHTFATWLRLYYLFNQDFEQETEGNTLIRTLIPDWMEEQIGVYRRSGDGWVFIPTGSIDPVGSVFGPLFQVLQLWQGDQDEVNQALNRDIPPIFEFLVDNSNQVVRALFYAARGTDAVGRDLRGEDVSFLGFRVPDLGFGSGTTRLFLENLIPYLAQLNRSNPFGIFGIKEVVDEYYNVVREGRLSIFGYPRTDRDPHLVGDGLSIKLRIARTLGFTVHPVEMERNARGSYWFYSEASKEFSTLRKKWERKAREEREAGNLRLAEEATVKAGLYAAHQAETELLAEELKLYLRTRGIPLSQTEQERTQLELDILSLQRRLRDK